MITFAAVLALFANMLVAGNDYIDPPANSAVTRPAIVSLTPAIPSEATFEDAVVISGPAGLAPVLPSEAMFEEVVTKDISADGFTPVIPSEADFE